MNLFYLYKLLFLIHGCLIILTNSSRKLYRTYLPRTPDITSRCNDGTIPVYFQSEYDGNKSGGWLIMLEGGGQCYDLQSCRSRYQSNPYLTTSHPNLVHEFGVVDGILSDDENKNRFHDYNVVQIHYCSSDGWHGYQQDVFDGFPEMKYFQGAQIIRDVFKDLLYEKKILSIDDNIVMGGFSAGARGTMVNGDSIRSEFGFENMLLFLDSPYYVNIDGTPLVDQTVGVFNHFVSGSPIVEKNHVKSWHDLFGEYRVPKIKTNFVLIASQFDQYQLGYGINAVDFSNYTRNSLSILDPLADHFLIYSSTYNTHAICAGSSYFHDQIDDVYLYQQVNLLGDIVFGKTPTTVSNTNLKHLEGGKYIIDPRSKTCSGGPSIQPKFTPFCHPQPFPNNSDDELLSLSQQNVDFLLVEKVL